MPFAHREHESSHVPHVSVVRSGLWFVASNPRIEKWQLSMSIVANAEGNTNILYQAAWQL